MDLWLAGVVRTQTRGGIAHGLLPLHVCAAPLSLAVVPVSLLRVGSSRRRATAPASAPTRGPADTPIPAVGDPPPKWQQGGRGRMKESYWRA